MRELFHEIASSIRQNKLRTALTGFAVSWGIFLLIALLGAGNGLMNSFSGNMEQYVSQTVTVSGWRTSKPYAGYKENRNIQLDQRDLNYTEGPEWEGVIDNVSVATSSQSVKLTLEGRNVNGWMRGVMPDFQETEKLQMSAGRFLNVDDIKGRRKVIVVRRSQATELSPRNPEALIGQWISAGSVAFRVVGIYHTDEQDFRQTCPIPYSTYKGIYDHTDKIEDISFTVNGPSTLKEHQDFEDSYTGALKRMHDIAPDDRRGIWVRNGYTDNLEMSNASRILSLAMWILGLLTLVSGIVGVSNIMLITVKERTHEFGIRKAIGASPWNITKLIISESIGITAFFGYIGMVLGMIACFIMDRTLGQETMDMFGQSIRLLINPTVGLSEAIKSTVLLVISGTVAGLFPAVKAARVRPIEALRAD